MRLGQMRGCTEFMKKADKNEDDVAPGTAPSV